MPGWLSDALDDLIEETIGTDKLTPEEKERIIRLRLHESEPEQLFAAVRHLIKDTDAIFQKRIAEFEPTPPGGRHPANANKLPARMRKVWPKKTLPKGK